MRAMRLNGFAILKSVADHEDLFSDAHDAVDKAALNIVATELKAKTFDLDRLQLISGALGSDALALVLEQVSDTVPKALIVRLDPHHPKIAIDNAKWMRPHIVALASGAVKPEPKPQVSEAKTSSKSKKKQKSEEDIIAENFWPTSVMATRRPKATGKPK
jgi:hypothetical protein